MPSNEEKIVKNGKVYAIIIRSDIKIDGVEFFTPEQYPFQLGLHIREVGNDIRPHIHKKIKREIELSQEALHIIYGKVEVDFFDEEKNKIATIVLNSGDTMLLVRGGHGFKVLEKTKMIEVKQGPYEGIEKDKELLKSKFHKD